MALGFYFFYIFKSCIMWPEDVGLFLKTFNLLQVWNEYNVQLLFVNTAKGPSFFTLFIMIEEVLQFLIG